jgi:hypothetical protein
MGYQNTSPVFGFQMIEIPRMGNANDGQTINGDASRTVHYMFGSATVLVHGVMMRWLASNNGSTAAVDNPLFNFTFRNETTVSLSSGALNIINDLQTAVGDTTSAGALCWVPAVQARRFAHGTDSAGVTSGPFTVSSSPVWPSGDWLGATTNTSRVVSARAALDTFSFPRLSVAVTNGAGAGTPGVIDGLSVVAAVTLFPPSQNVVTSDEIAAADYVASRAILGAGLVGPEAGPSWLGISVV